MLKKVTYLFVFFISAIIVGFAYYGLLKLIPLSQDATFVISFVLVIVTMIFGALYEDKLWRGYFGDEREYPYGSSKRLAPLPISMGAVIGILSFLHWP